MSSYPAVWVFSSCSIHVSAIGDTHSCTGPTRFTIALVRVSSFHKFELEKRRLRKKNIE